MTMLRPAAIWLAYKTAMFILENCDYRMTMEHMAADCASRGYTIGPSPVKAIAPTATSSSVLENAKDAPPPSVFTEETDRDIIHSLYPNSTFRVIDSVISYHYFATIVSLRYGSGC